MYLENKFSCIFSRNWVLKKIDRMWPYLNKKIQKDFDGEFFFFKIEDFFFFIEISKTSEKIKLNNIFFVQKVFFQRKIKNSLFWATLELWNMAIIFLDWPGLLKRKNRFLNLVGFLIKLFLLELEINHIYERRDLILFFRSLSK